MQCSICVLAWAQDGNLLDKWEKVVLPLLLVYTFCVSLLGAITVRATLNLR